MTNARNIIVLTSLISLLGCAVADIRPLSMRREAIKDDAISKGESLFNDAYKVIDPQNKWYSLDYLEATAVDAWASGLLRSLTPLTANKERVHFTFTIHEPGTRLTFLEGKHKGDEVIDNEGGLKAGLYLPYVRDYFLWPFALKSFQFKTYAGEGKYGDQTYRKVFVSHGKWAPNAKDNQYIVWINATTGQMDIVEFTLRELSKSYRGVIFYSDFRDVRGFKTPFQLKIADNLKKPKISHTLTVEDVVLK